jgi:ESS family glutamate:Na+ symporter
MIAAALLRNFDDVFGVIGISQRMVDDLGNVSLYLFIVMALLTLRLWELVNLALPLLVLLIAQVALVWFMCVWLSFRVMGRDYQAAVMAGGFCGFMLGTTANAMACMDVLTQKYGPAPRAYIVVPLVGAFLIDFTNALVITNTTDFVRYLLK